MTFQIMHRGQAHTPGDSFVWLDSADTMFTGDIVYVERILGNGGQSNAKSWIAAFEAMATFDPTHIVPGHGHATDMATARADTYDYLVNLRARIGALLDEGGSIIDAPGIDQSAGRGWSNSTAWPGATPRRPMNRWNGNRPRGARVTLICAVLPAAALRGAHAG